MDFGNPNERYDWGGLVNFGGRSDCWLFLKKNKLIWVSFLGKKPFLKLVDRTPTKQQKGNQFVIFQ
jgi:hypothetical protein